MDLRELETFRAVAELGSLTKAADKLHVAQPALSRQIKLLESELRTDLFTRDGRGMRLTAAGETLFDRTTGLLRDVHQLRDDLRSFSGTPTGTVSVGMVPTVSALVSGPVARRVLHELPGVALRLAESYTGHLVDWLHRGQLDVAVLYGRSDALHMRTESLGYEELVAVSAAGSGLADRGEVGLAWLLDQPLALPSESHGLRHLVTEAADQLGCVPRVVLEGESFRILVEFAVQGLGFTVLPGSAVRHEVETGRLETAGLAGAALRRELVLAWPGTGSPSIAVKSVAKVLRDQMKAALGPG